MIISAFRNHIACCMNKKKYTIIKLPRQQINNDKISRITLIYKTKCVILLHMRIQILVIGETKYSYRFLQFFHALMHDSPL